MNKTTINISLLQALVPTQQDEFTQMLTEQLGDQSELAQALKEIQQQERIEKTKASARELQKVVQLAGDTTVSMVHELRDLKNREAQVRAELKAISRARDFGYETMNFLPLVALLTGHGRENKVPEGWEPKNPSAKEVVPRKRSK